MSQLESIIDDDGTTLASYDGTGRLITTTVTATVTGQSPATASTDNYYSGQQLIQSVASGGGPVYKYVWSARSEEAPVLGDTIVGGTPDVTQRLYYLDDANYNITARVSYTGTVLERYQYDAYGNVTVCDAGWNPLASNASQYSSAILFAGCQLDANAGLYLMGRRGTTRPSAASSAATRPATPAAPRTTTNTAATTRWATPTRAGRTMPRFP